MTRYCRKSGRVPDICEEVSLNLDTLFSAARELWRGTPFALTLAEPRRPTLPDRIGDARVWLALRLIGNLPVVMNVEVGDCDGYAVRAVGSLRSNAVMRPSDKLMACIRVDSFPASGKSNAPAVSD